MEVSEILNKGLKREFKVVVPQKSIQEQMDKKIGDLAKRVKLPGFRPGKVPLSLVKERYADSVRAEVAQDLLKKGSDKVLKDNKLTPAMQPSIDVESFDDEKGLHFKMSLEIMPQVPEASFEDMKLEDVDVDVSDKEVEKAIAELAKGRRVPEEVTTKRKSKSGEVLVIDFKGSVDGKLIDGGSGTDYPLELGSNTFIPGFEDQLVGSKVGDEVEVKVPFPKEYHEKSLAGKDAIFQVTVKGLKTLKEASIDEDLAKSFGMESLEKLKEFMKTRLEADAKMAARTRLKRHVLDALSDKYKFDVPESMVKAEFDAIWNQLNAELERAGETQTAAEEKKLTKEYQTIAERRVRLGLLLSEVGQKQKISVTNQELQQALMAKAQSFPGQEKQVFDFYRKNPQALAQLRAPIFEEKVVDFIVSKAKLTKKKVTFETLMKDPALAVSDEDEKA